MAATPGQVFDVLGNLANRVRWDLFDKDRFQEEVVKQPDRVAREFEQFVQNGGRMVNAGNMKVVSLPFDPAAFINKGWSIIKEERDLRSYALAQADMAEAEFLFCLEEGENQISGEEKLKRLKAENRIRYGAAVFMGLWQDYQTNKENSVLERLYQQKRVTYMDFFGDVLLSPLGDRRVLCLGRVADGAWHWHCRWLGLD